MPNVEVVVLVLAVGNLLSTGVFIWVVIQLVDRLMSRNYPEFVQSKVYSSNAEKKQKSHGQVGNLDEEIVENEILNELNRQFPAN